MLCKMRSISLSVSHIDYHYSLFDHLQDLTGEVGEDDVRPGPPHAHQDLRQCGLQVNGPLLARVVQHGKLPGHLVGKHRMVF